MIGGAASAARGPGGNRLVLDGRITTTGAVGVFVDGLPVRAVVSQGCRPVGAPYVITRGEGNRIEELAGSLRASTACRTPRPTRARRTAR